MHTSPPFKDTSRRFQMPLVLTCRTSSSGHPCCKENSLDSGQPSAQPKIRDVKREGANGSWGTLAISATDCFPLLTETSRFLFDLEVREEREPPLKSPEVSEMKVGTRTAEANFARPALGSLSFRQPAANPETPKRCETKGPGRGWASF